MRNRDGQDFERILSWSIITQFQNFKLLNIDKLYNLNIIKFLEIEFYFILFKNKYYSHLATQPQICKY